MALCRLLLPRPLHHLHKTALPKSARWCSSSSDSGAKKSSCSEAAKEQRAAAEESDNKYMEMHSGVSLKPTKGQNTVGESWHALKGIFTDLKARILRSPRFQKQNTVGTTAPNRTDTVVIETKITPRNTEVGQANHNIEKPEVIRDSDSCKENISMSLRSDITGENSSPEVLDATASNQVEVHKHSYSTKVGKPKGIVQASGGVVCSSENLVGLIVSDARKEHTGTESIENNSKNEPSHIRGGNSLSNLVGRAASKHKEKQIEHGVSGSLVQSSEAFMDSQNNEKCVRAPAASNITWKRASKDMDRSEVKLESRRELAEMMVANIGVLESETEHQSCLTRQLLGKESRILQKDAANGFTMVGNGSHQLDKRTWICDQTPSAGTDVGIIPASSDGSQEVGLANMFMRTMNDQKADKMPSEQRSDTLVSNGLLEMFNETSETNETTDEEDIINISGLIGCIKELPTEPLVNMFQNCAVPDKTDHIITRGGSVKRVPSRADSHKCDAKRRESSLRGDTMGRKTNTVSGNEEQPFRGIPSLTHKDSVSESDGDDLKVVSRKKSKLSPQVHLRTSKEELDKITSTLHKREGSTESSVLVRFLHRNVKEDSVFDGLNHCGEIVKIQLLSLIEGSNFRDACVHFKTREGSQKALTKSDLIIGSSAVFVEPTSLEDVPNKVSVPNLIGDPEAPIALVKNPTRTVMIKQLTHDISSNLLKEALAFCGSGISSFFLGSSGSVAYVEFETEDAKERAIAAFSINVQGKQLSIVRLDAPRTTVIRISNFDESLSTRKIFSRCKSHGQVKSLRLRSKGILDVHFRLAEWPNMLTILNSLNGIEVAGYRLVAQPAPVFPPEILQALWSRPDERIHVQSVLRRLLQNTELNVELTNLANKYYKDIL